MVASHTLAGSIARKGLLRDYIAIMIGAFTMAVGLAVFLVDAKVVPGGVSGLSMAVHYLSGNRVPVGLTMWPRWLIAVMLLPDTVAYAS